MVCVNTGAPTYATSLPEAARFEHITVQRARKGSTIDRTALFMRRPSGVLGYRLEVCVVGALK